MSISFPSRRFIERVKYAKNLGGINISESRAVSDTDSLAEYGDYLNRPSETILDIKGGLARFFIIMVPVFAGLLALFLYGKVAGSLAWNYRSLLQPALWAIFLTCILLAWFRYPLHAKPLRILFVGLSITLALYGLALGRHFALLDGALGSSIDRSLQPFSYALLPLAILSAWRPSFGLFPFIYVAIHKHLSRALSGAFELGVNDYLPLVEIGVFIGSGTLALAIMLKFAGEKISPRERSPGEIARLCCSAILVVAIGAHLGNYFMSGMAKILLDGGVLSWAFENPTSSLMLAGYNLGTAPLSIWPGVFTTVYGIFKFIEIPMNVVTLSAQLLCFLAFFRKRLAIAFAGFFDIMHISIFILTGALFIPWIILNSLIVAAVARTEKRWNGGIIALGIIATVAGHQMFYNAQLGWYDSREVNHRYFVAITDDGEEAAVPSSFFRDASYLMLARHFGYREHRLPSGHVPTSAWGQIGIKVEPPEDSGWTNYSIMQATKSCSYPVTAPTAPVDYDEERAEAFIKAQHTRALNLEASGASSYNLYPHHHFSMPSRFADFASLELSDIVAYRYVVETVCLSVEDGVVRREVKARTDSGRIPVGEE